MATPMMEAGMTLMEVCAVAVNFMINIYKHFPLKLFSNFLLFLLWSGKSSSRLHVSAREYYCYMMQVREGVFVIFFYGGRLFQQWIVDIYIKIESMRLDWYSNPEHQKIIRADLYQVNIGPWSVILI